MVDIRIRRFDKRVRVPQGLAAFPRRLDAVWQEVVDRGLDLALELAGVTAHEEICVRHVRAPIRLDPRGSNANLAATWSDGLARAIARACSMAATDQVVRYASRAQRLADLAVRVVRGDFGRAWAWRQLGSWSLSDAPSPGGAAAELVRVLVRQPEFVVATLLQVARQDLLSVLVTRLDASAWIELAAAALVASGAASAADVTDTGVAVGLTAARPLAASVVRRSVLARHFALRSQGLRERLPDDAVVARAGSVLCVLEADPGTLRGDRSSWHALLAAVAEALTGAAESVAPTSEPARSADLAADAAAPAQGAAGPPAPRPRARVSEPDDRVADVPPAADDGRARGRTAFGGLLFLLRIVDQLDLVGLWRRDPALLDASTSWCLHRLAASLVAIDPRDPAALAFCGLLPGSDPPDDEARHAMAPAEPAAMAAREQRIRAAADAVRQALCTLFDRDADAADLLVSDLCARNAEIVADPGWFEVHLSLAEVSTDVRRAGLDLDLGFLAWLGAVVVFIYE